MKYRFRWIQAAVFATAACTGSIDSGEEGSQKDDEGDDRGGPGTGASSGSARGDDDEQPPMAIVPGPAPLRRLSNDEYLNSVRDLLGADPSLLAQISLVADFAPDTFAHNVDLQTLSAEHVGAYAKAAKLLADDVFANRTRREALLGCGAPVGADCLRTFVETFGLRAYRRRLLPDEVDAYLALAGSEPDREAGARLVVRTMLQAPHFLFRPEFGAPGDAPSGLARLSGFELATRLSYLMWGTTPSLQLLLDGERGALDRAADLADVARTLLADERAKPVLRRFVREGFGTADLEQLTRDAKRFPGWTVDVRRSAGEELIQLAEHLVWSDDGDFRMLIDAPFTFVDQHVAKLYGLPAPAQAGWQKVDFAPGTPRAGLVTMPAMLAVTGRQDGASAIWRGAYVRTHLLCEELPTPPANVPPLEAVDANLPERERLAQHRDNPACASCHRLLDPIGFGLSQYDAIGMFRQQDEAGRPIRDDGFIEGPVPGIDDGTFRGGVELAKKLRQSPQATRCLTQKLTGFLLGRNLVESDEPLIAHLHDELDQRGRVPDVLLDFVGSDAFRRLAR